MDRNRFPELELKSKLRMPAGKVAELYSLFESNGIEVWVDGGWGVDALLEEQTREHADLDIVVQEKDVPELRSLLESMNYREVPRDDSSPRNFVLGDGQGDEIDVHVVRFNEEGVGIYRLDRNENYPAGSLTGDGIINARQVQCISPDWMVKFHTGYELSDADRHDVKALCDKFGIELPEVHKS